MIRNIKNKLKNTIHLLKICINSGQINFYNFWTENNIDDYWLYRFVKSRKINNKISFFSVFGKRFIVDYSFGVGKKVFFTGENLTETNISTKEDIEYKDHCLNSVDLSLGFDYIDHPKYMRFPLWIKYLTNGTEQSINDIEEKINNINNPRHRLSKGRNYFASLISRHDEGGTRMKLINLLNPINKVVCAGTFMNNTNNLKEKFNDNNYFKHIGVYAFRKQALLNFAKLPMRPLEIAEKIECLRYLEYGMKIKMIETDFVGVGIDVPEDLEKARRIIEEKY